MLRLSRALLSTSAGSALPVVRIAHASVFGPGASHRASPIIADLDWSVNDGEAWAVVDNATANTEGIISGKSAIIQLLLGHLRLSPAGADPLPFLRGEDSRDAVHAVAFSTRPRSWGSSFYDYSARYGAARGEDARTFRHVLQDLGAHNEQIDTLATRLEVHDLLDLPLVALSNGQTRRARVMQALLRAPAPKLLVLDEPLSKKGRNRSTAGLDPHARPVLSALLQSLHEEKAPRVIMALRAQDPLPEWITHVLRVSDGRAETITASSFTPAEMQVSKPATSPRHHRQHVEERGDVLAELKDVNVAYHERRVLRDVNWTIRAGEKWHLQGYNGSGKTTLTSLLTGAHPQSYTQKHLHLFGLPRPKMPTPVLAQRIGHTSPEIAAAAPRRATLTAADLIGTGFDGHFAWRARSASEAARVRDVMASLGIADKPVTELAPGEHATVLLARALVARPELVILDEAFMGMSKAQVERATRFLRDELGEGQAAVWIGHWEGECPWGDADRLHRIRLDGGKAEIV
ncbi:P-loop containing nucleoside triphosphate hydrolase protein [Auricularia subglabra TFB-10046 SS5]|nr:P-loop containing nucleoside triphosphate hydrolase protein [Auricularia subglabra TFB-10046 SS5]